MPTYPELLLALAELVEQNEAKTLRLETQSKLLRAQAPAVEFAKSYQRAPGEY